MSKFKNYVNPISKTNNIYSLEDLCNMTLYNVSDNLETLKAQNKTIGFPFNEELQSSSNVVYVEAYTHSDGTLVHAHWRSKSDSQGAFGQMQTTPNYTNSQPINTASFIDNTLNMPTSVNDNVQTQRPLQRQQQGQNLYNQNPMPVFNTGIGQMNTLTLANYDQSFNNVQPTLANFDNQVMSRVGNQPQNLSNKSINDAICQLVSGKPKQECSPEDIAYMNKKIIQEINSYYEPPKVSEKENTEKFMNVFTRSILSQMIKDAQKSSKIANGTETGYATDIPKENNAESFVGNDAQSESTLTGEISRKNLFSSLNNAVLEKINGMRNKAANYVQNRIEYINDKATDFKDSSETNWKILHTLWGYYKEALPYYEKYKSFDENITDIAIRENKKKVFMSDTVRKFSSEGYIKPTNLSKTYTIFDFENLKFNYELNKNRPDAQELYRIAVLGIDSYPNNSQFVHIPKEQTNNIQSMFYLNDKALIKSGMKGIAFNSNSDFSKRLSTSKELQNAISQDIYHKNKTEKEPYLIIDFQKDKNLHLSIGHGRVIYRLTNDGYVEGCLFDKYDFDLIRSKYTLDNNGIITIANNYSYFRSLYGKLENYYYIVNFKYKLNK